MSGVRGTAGDHHATAGHATLALSVETGRRRAGASWALVMEPGAIVAETPVRAAPLPLKAVAVTVPATSSLVAGVVVPMP